MEGFTLLTVKTVQECSYGRFNRYLMSSFDVSGTVRSTGNIAVIRTEKLFSGSVHPERRKAGKNK